MRPAPNGAADRRPARSEWRKPERFAQFARELEMPAVDRIEGAAEDAENGMHRKAKLSGHGVNRS